MLLRAVRTALILSAFAPVIANPVAADDFDPRVACWDGNLAVCEYGLMEHPGDLRWLDTAANAYFLAGPSDRGDEIGAQFIRQLNKLKYSYAGVRRLARDEMTSGNYMDAVRAYEVLLDFQDDVALITEIDRTYGDPAPLDGATIQAIDDAIDALLVEAYEGRGLALIMAGFEGSGLADLHLALEHGPLRETLRLLADHGIAYEPSGDLEITEIDAALERALRELAAQG